MKVSETLIKAIEDYKNGDQVAFNTIYNESHKYIYVCVNNVVSGNDNKEEMICDIMQDTYVEISKHIDSLQNANLFLSWAGTIATRKCYEYIKKSGKYVLLNEDESFDTLADDDNIIPEEIMQNKEKQNLLRDIIQNELTEMQKLCIVGYFYNEMKQSEIAEELGIPENSVKSHLLRAKAKIKDAVVDLEKNKGTKLYSVSPLLLLLFADEVQTCVVSSTIGQTVLAGIGLGGAQVAATGAGVASAGTASVASASTASVASASTSVGTTAATVATTAAKGAVVAFKVKAIAIASAAVLTVAGVGAGVGIAIHNKNEAKETEVTTEETTKEIVTEVETEEVSTDETTTDETVTEETPSEEISWEDVVFAQCGQMYDMQLSPEKEIGEDNFENEEYIISSMVKSITVSSTKVIVKLADITEIDANKHVNFDEIVASVLCKLVNKTTGEEIKTITKYIDETTIVFNKYDDYDNLKDVDFTDCAVGLAYDNRLTLKKYEGWLFYEGLREEPDDGLKSTLVDAAQKILDEKGEPIVVAFADYDGDRVPEFFYLEPRSYGNLYGEMYKYENNEYVYWMDVRGLGDGCTKLYKDKTDGSYVVWEFDYSFYVTDDDDYMSYNYINIIDMDKKERICIASIEGDINIYIDQRIFYKEDGTNVIAEEFFATIEAEMLQQYEYVGDIRYGWESFGEDDSNLVSAYNYYLIDLSYLFD